MNYTNVIRRSNRVRESEEHDSIFGWVRLRRRISRFSLVTLSACVSMMAFGQQGTWTPIAAPCPESPETALLLMDGSVFVKSFDNYAHCFKLTPNGTDYSSGTWKQLADMPVGLIYGPTGVLLDGRVIVGGGEYLSPGQTDNDSISVYNPVTNAWTRGPDGLYGYIRDTAASPTPNGNYLVSFEGGNQMQIFNPTTMSWSVSAPMITPAGQSWGGGDEQGYQILPDGSIIGVFFWGQRYLPTLDEWVLTPPLPNTLVDPDFEMGPTVMLYNGTLLAFSATCGTGATAIYTPPSSLLATDDSWAVGPVIPGGQGCADTPACVEANGKVLFVSAPTDYDSGPTFDEYDPGTGLITQISAPTSFTVSYAMRMLALPNGQVWVSNFGQNGNQIYLYTPSSGPQSSWRANLTSLTLGSNSRTYTITGTQLNGLTNGAAYGDECEQYTNYPIVMLKNAGTGLTYYASASHPSNFLLAQGSTPSQVNFTIPSSVPAGRYQVSTSASGVSSANTLTIGFGFGMPPAATVTATPGGTVQYSMPVTDFFLPAGTLTAKVSHGPSWVTWNGTTLTASPPPGTLVGDYPLTLYASDSTAPSAAGTTGIMIRVASTTLQSAKFSPPIVYGGGTTHLMVSLSQPAPQGGTVVNLSTGSRFLTVPATFTIPEGSSTASIPIPAGSPTTVTGASVYVNLGRLLMPAEIRIFPPAP